MKKYFKLMAILSLFLLLISCGEKEIKEIAEIKEITYDEFISGEYPNYTGYVIAYMSDGYTMKGMFKDGIENGEIVMYNEEGTIISKGNVKDGERDGEQIGYYPNGKIQYKAIYKDGLEIESTYYDENGEILNF